MAVWEILKMDHPVFAAKTETVGLEVNQTKEVQTWIDDLFDTMRLANGAGIAANQVGIPYRLFTLESGKPLTNLANQQYLCQF